ncbi:wax ester/triacylglycerol synthase family O-acyltransferase [Vulgatibacter sp.]|uniref:wax ester/triacylglycerol synthase family O-acyltransferase n=1 Tax=Vulgatibacter sp. TaxID=1971226 RepID=UPI0035675AF3
MVTWSQLRRVPLSGVDSAWLRMEEPGNPMIVVALLTFATPLAVERLREVVRGRFLRFAPFRSCVVERHLGLPQWEEAPALDLDWHVVEERLPPPGSEGALQRRVSELLGAHLDPDRPLWRMHLVQGFGTGSALVCRIHHAYGDGTALLHVLLSLTEGASDEPPLLHRSLSRQQAGLGDLLEHPGQAIELARRGVSGAASLGRLLLLPPDPPTSLRGPLSGSKRAAWTAPLPLDPLRDAAHRGKGKLNDLLVAGAAGALRHVLQARGESVDGLSFRALVPVDLRPPEDFGRLGNHFGLVFLDLPVGIRGPRHRLAEARARMEALKRSPEAIVAFHLLHALGLATPELEALGVRFFSTKASLVLTNVAGPTDFRTLAGGRVESLLFWVPASGGIGLGLSLFSYAGSLRLAVGADAQRLPEPEALVADFERELVRLA